MEKKYIYNEDNTIRLRDLSDVAGIPFPELSMKASYYSKWIDFCDMPEGMLDKVKKFAKEQKVMCLAEYYSPSKGFWLMPGTITCKGLSNCTMFFNFTVLTSEYDDGKHKGVHAVIYNTGKGALTKYWEEEYLVEKPGCFWFGKTYAL